ncbi:MAG: hypothetical protein Q4P17_03990 [Methanobacterium sp.]|nr:hypothetical protein [Methanobacterium sp.]
MNFFKKNTSESEPDLLDKSDELLKEQEEMKRQKIEMNRLKLESFGTIIDGGRVATAEQRRKRIKNWELVRKIAKFGILLGIFLVYVINSNFGTKVILGCIGIIALSIIMINLNMTSQMREEYQKQKESEMRDKFGITDPNKIATQMLSQSNDFFNNPSLLKEKENEPNGFEFESANRTTEDKERD